MSHDTSERSIKRRNNLRKVIAALRIAPLSVGDIGELIGYSPSGARKYRTSLIAAGLLVTTTEVGFYALTSDTGLIDAYCKCLETHAPKCIDGKPKARKSAILQPGRHIYSQDDSLAMDRLIKRKIKIPAPHDVLAHFYGFVGA